MSKSATRRIFGGLIWFGCPVAAAGLIFGWYVVRKGDGGLRELKPHEVGVLIDHVRGTRRVLTDPGYYFTWPFVQRLEVFDKRPVEFVMSGDEPAGHNRVPFLSVRALDGSEFWFESLAIHYQIDPLRADVVLADSGPGENFQEQWMRTVARTILRDEYGRLVAQDSADSTLSSLSKQRSLERLKETLAPHGLEVVQLITPKPKFDRAYEKAIEDRKVLEQEAERLENELAEIGVLRDAALAKLANEHQLQLEVRRSELKRLLLEMESFEIEAVADAKRYALQRGADAEIARTQRETDAQAQVFIAQEQAVALSSEVAAHAESGDAAVREALTGWIGRMKPSLIALTPVPARP